MAQPVRPHAVTKRDLKKGTPNAFLSQPRPPGAVVVCIGDSITAADMSSDWVQLLRQKFASRGWTFVNAGINGNLAWNVLQRLDAVIACKPDAVVLFIGTNDVGATINDKTTKSMIKQQNLPHRPTLKWYRDNLDTILARLTTETAARIAVVEIPPLGETITSGITVTVEAYNHELRAAAAAHQVEVIPLSAALLSEIPNDHHPRPYAHEVTPMLRAVLFHSLFNRSWDDISKHNGLLLLTDWVHLNDRAGRIVARLVERFLDRAPSA